MRMRPEDLFHEVVELSAHERRRYFQEHHIEDKMREEVEELLAFDRLSEDTLDCHIRQLAQHVLDGGASPVSFFCGPYRLGRLLGSGGMGTVYAAERADGEISRQVAVKLLRPGANAAHIRRRFLAERQILANLSHPNIATLLDAGHREDGQPYLVLEHIQGQAIDLYTASFTVRQKIALFLRVCAAVSYLHRNLVVHRDLKPANILITDEGEPKILDFGIAKLLDLTTDSTATIQRMLTPDYASPEQVSGGPITTAADIYSLGAVLYKIVTGESPHRFDSESSGGVAQAILNVRIVPPSRLAPAARGDLDIVLMKALRREPEERYDSVDALADDLRACLERRPVRARAGDAWYRARRWARCYWMPAAAAIFVASALSTGLFIANRQRAIAERRFEQLRLLSNRVIDLDAAIRTLPGSVEARKRLVADSLEYLEGLAGEGRQNLELAREVSDGYWRLARIQGVNAEFNLGEVAQAEESLKKADALIELVLASRPLDRNALFRSALIAHDRMIISSDARRDDALAHARQSAGRLETLLQSGAGDTIRLHGFLLPGDPGESERRGIATIYSNLALAYTNAHRFEEGGRYARRAVELARPIPSAQDIAAAGLSVLANDLRYQGDLDGALNAIHEARALTDQVSYPDEAARLLHAYGPLLREGRILAERDAVNLGRPSEAIGVLQQALDLSEEAARKDPKDAASRSRVGTIARELGDILRDRDPRRALAVFELGIQRTAETPDALHTRRETAELLARAAYPLRRLHRPAEAKGRLDAAVAILRRTKDYPPRQIELGNPVYSVVRALADEEAETGDRQRAFELYEDFLEKILASKPQPETNLQDAARISSVYQALSAVSRRAGHHDRASSLDALRLELWRHWDSRLPGNSFIRRQIEAASRRTQS
ncbi:MAG TPA: serine/threonine-protein kinase [Bryobacteraceae bacterium]|nr:serine/threonine-protein kinase [Bryobacteraceae bacterium]